ncbi:MAG: S24 family peptidase [Bacteroidales bacterium]|nr:S24 family peptidase [Bacteroidales bacterium]
MHIEENTLYRIDIDDEFVVITTEGSIPCGAMGEAGQFVERREKLSEFMCLGNGSYVGIHVHGDSMIDARIFPGDLVLIDKDVLPNSGDIVVVRLDDCYTVKYLYHRNGEIMLLPANENYSAITFAEGDEPEIVGVVQHIITAAVHATFREIEQLKDQKLLKQRENEVIDRTIDEGLMESPDVWAKHVTKEQKAVWVAAVSDALEKENQWAWAEERWDLKNLRISYNNAINSERFDEYDAVVKRILNKG